MMTAHTHVYAIVTTKTKNECLREEKVKFMSSIDPVTRQYEKERFIMNCFTSLDTAVSVFKSLINRNGKDIIGFGIPSDSFVREIPPLYSENRRNKKQQTSDDIYRYIGVKNYADSFRYRGTDYEYIVIADITCIQEIFDPGIKNRRVNSCGFYAPDTTLSTGDIAAPVQEGKGSIQKRMAAPVLMPLQLKDMGNKLEISSVTAIAAFLAGIVLGYVMGIYSNKCSVECPELPYFVVAFLVIIFVVGIWKHGKIRELYDKLIKTLMGE